MARSFSGNNANRLSSTTVPITTWPLTMACWANCAAINTSYAFMSLWSSTTNYIALGTNSTANAIFQTNDNVGLVNATASTTFSADTWFHACGVYSTATSRTVHYNGGNSGNSVQNRNPTGLNNIFIGSRNLQLPLNGRVAWATIWNVALTATEIFSLSRGVYPLLVRPNNIVAFYPLFGRGSTEPDLIARNDLVITGTVPHYFQPRIIGTQ
jgi:hypothetical protein